MLVGTFLRNWRNKQKGDRIVLSHDTCVYDDHTVKVLVAENILGVEETKPSSKKGAKIKE